MSPTARLALGAAALVLGTSSYATYRPMFASAAEKNAIALRALGAFGFSSIELTGDDANARCNHRGEISRAFRAAGPTGVFARGRSAGMRGAPRRS